MSGRGIEKCLIFFDSVLIFNLLSLFPPVLQESESVLGGVLGPLTVCSLCWVCCVVWKVCVLWMHFFSHLFYTIVMFCTSESPELETHDGLRLLLVLSTRLVVGTREMKCWRLAHRSCSNSPGASLSLFSKHFWVFLTADILPASLLILPLNKAHCHINQSRCTFPSPGVIFLLCHRFLASVLWLCILLSLRFSCLWNPCQAVIITVRYRMSFSPTLCAWTHAGTHTHTQRHTKMRRWCQLGEMAAITLIAAQRDTISADSPLTVSFCKLRCCVPVLVPILCLKKKKKTETTELCHLSVISQLSCHVSHQTHLDFCAHSGSCLVNVFGFYQSLQFCVKIFDNFEKFFCLFVFD